MIRHLSAVSFAFMVILAAAPARAIDQWWDHGKLPIPDGARLTLELDKLEYFLGENVLVRFVLENTGDKPFQIEIGGDYRGANRAMRFIVSAFDENGNAKADPDETQSNMGGLSGQQTVEPGAKWYAWVPLLRYRKFDKPGQYTIRVSHDLGWKQDDTHKRPVGETKIKFIMPTPEQAETVVEAMDVLPIDTGRNMGKKWSDYPDFTTLRHAVYLPALFRRAESGSRDVVDHAIDGIGSIETPEATGELIKLLEAPGASPLHAALVLIARLPDPEPEKTSTARASDRDPWREKRQELAGKAWDAKFTAPVRAFATRMLTTQYENAVNTGASMLLYIGTEDDLPALLSALDRSLANNTPRTGEGANVLDPPGTARELLRTLHALAKRGAKVTTDPQTPGQIALYLDQLATNPDFRPTDSADRTIVWMTHPSAFIRERALRDQPTPAPDKARAVLVKMFDDPDLGVQRAVCEYAGKAHDTTLIAGVLKVLAGARENFTFNAAGDAALQLSATADAYETVARRLDGPKMLFDEIHFLARVVVYPGYGNGGNSNVSPQQIAAIKDRWLAFLAAHRDEIQAGKRFKIGDPELTPDLFAPVYQFGTGDHKEWPPAEK